jgi:hypothetical protein
LLLRQRIASVVLSNCHKPLQRIRLGAGIPNALHFRRVDRVDHAAHLFGRGGLLADEATATIVVLKVTRGLFKRYSATGAALVLDIEIARDILHMFRCCMWVTLNV